MNSVKLLVFYQLLSYRICSWSLNPFIFFFSILAHHAGTSHAGHVMLNKQTFPFVSLSLESENWSKTPELRSRQSENPLLKVVSRYPTTRNKYYASNPNRTESIRTRILSQTNLNLTHILSIRWLIMISGSTRVRSVLANLKSSVPNAGSASTKVCVATWRLRWAGRSRHCDNEVTWTGKSGNTRQAAWHDTNILKDVVKEPHLQVCKTGWRLPRHWLPSTARGRYIASKYWFTARIRGCVFFSKLLQNVNSYQQFTFTCSHSAAPGCPRVHKVTARICHGQGCLLCTLWIQEQQLASEFFTPNYASDCVAVAFPVTSEIPERRVVVIIIGNFLPNRATKKLCFNNCPPPNSI